MPLKTGIQAEVPVLDLAAGRPYTLDGLLTGIGVWADVRQSRTRSSQMYTKNAWW